MKNQAYFLGKIKVKIIKVSSAAILLGALRVKYGHRSGPYQLLNHFGGKLRQHDSKAHGH